MAYGDSRNSLFDAAYDIYGSQDTESGRASFGARVYDIYGRLTPDPPPPRPNEEERRGFLGAIGDQGLSVLRGGLGIGQGLSWVAEKSRIPGLEDVGDWAGGMFGRTKDYWEKQYSPEAKEARAGGALGSFEGFLHAVSEAAPSFLASAGLGTVAAKGIQSAVRHGPSMFKSVDQIRKLAPVSDYAARLNKNIERVAGLAGGAIGYGGSEAIIAAGSAGSAIEEQILEMAHEDLARTSARYNEIFGAAGDLAEAERIDYARQTLADETGGEVARRVAMTTFMLGAPAGMVLGTLSKGVAHGFAQGSRLKSAAVGAGTEAAQEFGQSGFEQLWSNLGIKKYVDPTQEETEGVLTAAVAGGLVGGVLGAGFGAGVYKAGKTEDPEKAVIDEEHGEALQAAMGGLRDADVDQGMAKQLLRWGFVKDISLPEFTGAAKELAETGALPESVALDTEGDFRDGHLTEQAFVNDWTDEDAVVARVQSEADPQELMDSLFYDHEITPYRLDNGDVVVPAKDHKALRVAMRKTGLKFEVVDAFRARAGVDVSAPTVRVEPRADVEVGDAAVDLAANRGATSPLNDLPLPTENQKKAGNYPKGHVNLGGVGVSIENARGSIRKGKGWSQKLKDHYGYILGTKGADGDQLDVFVATGAHREERPVFVINQQTKDGRFDELKVVMGARGAGEAKNIYNRNYGAGWKGMHSITKFSREQFDEWVRTGEHAKPVNPLNRATLEALPGQEQPTPPTGAEPAPQFSFVGPGGMTRIKPGEWGPGSPFDRALTMANAGRSNEETRQATGWFRGPDKRWRFEIDDQGFRLKSGAVEALRTGNNVPRRIGDMVEHPSLMKAYPGLADIPVDVRMGPQVVKSGRTEAEQGVNWRRPTRIKARGQGPEEITDVLLHEIQHVVQMQEGTAQGGSVDQFMAEEREKVTGADAKPDADLVQQAAFRRYRNLAGEIEARDVVDRRGYTDEDRALIEPALPLAGESGRAEVLFSLDEEVDAKVNAQKAPVEGLKWEDLNARVEKMQRGWAVRPAVVVSIQAELPAHILAHYDAMMEGRKNLPRIEGVYDPVTRRAYLVASNINSMERADRVLFEETLGHQGLHLTFGADLNPLLDQVFDAAGDRQSFQEIAQRYGFDMTTADGQRQAANEFLSKRDISDLPNLWQQFMGFVNRWLRDKGFEIQYSDGELKDLMELVRDRVQRGIIMPRSDMPSGLTSLNADGNIVRYSETRALDKDGNSVLRTETFVPNHDFDLGDLAVEVTYGEHSARYTQTAAFGESGAEHLMKVERADAGALPYLKADAAERGYQYIALPEGAETGDKTQKVSVPTQDGQDLEQIDAVLINIDLPDPPQPIDVEALDAGTLATAQARAAELTDQIAAIEKKLAGRTTSKAGPPNPLEDEFITLVAKWGGLDRGAWESEGVDPEEWRRKQGPKKKGKKRAGTFPVVPRNWGVFGKPLFRAPGTGMKPDDLAERLHENGFFPGQENYAVNDAVDMMIGAINNPDPSYLGPAGATAFERDELQRELDQINRLIDEQAEIGRLRLFSEMDAEQPPPPTDTDLLGASPEIKAEAEARAAESDRERATVEATEQRREQALLRADDGGLFDERQPLPLEPQFGLAPPKVVSITVPVTVEETGETMDVEMQSDQALEFADRRIQALTRLRECVQS